MARYQRNMDKILISACLLGRPLRYNGTAKASGSDAILDAWQAKGRLVAICPEVAVGFPTPRPPAEIAALGDGRNAASQGADVLAGQAAVVEKTGRDVSDLYRRAASDTVELATRHGCRHAVLTDGSPSCGSSFIYDGSFTGVTKAGMGTTAAALRQAGVRVWAETEIAALNVLLSES
ncbi:DUF523 domain-containing protein [Cognatiyoonia sp. IB215182]|uniref:DUF523 domain-containing protein n=1 Tax=Cognatiyoonia sp. IB215182 TaxID=3097353 RepID=UPI002A0B425C|nr:DUF523 domain-containing protein [Cognatiyoonia sp. IB215182]MDX8352676.1 DUF523 domain-containing protein [Cognatiyoonia sp. IB215182]